MWANTSVPWDVLQNSIDVVVGNAEIFNTRLCVVAPQLAGTKT